MDGLYVGGLFWDGRVDTLEEQAMQPLLNPLEMHNRNKRRVVVAVLRSDYAPLFIEVFGWSLLRDVDAAFGAVAEAIAAYERSDGLGLAEEEVGDIVTFLETLTDGYMP